MQDYFVCTRFYKPESYSKNRDASWMCYGRFRDFLSADQYEENNPKKFPEHQQSTLTSTLKAPVFIQEQLLKLALNKTNNDTSLTQSTVILSLINQ